MKKAIIAFCIFLCAFISKAQGPEVVVPVPAEFQILEGVYTFDSTPKVKERIMPSRFATVEAYRLEISPKGIDIKAGGEAGLFYAMQTLAQMTADGTVNELKCCWIEDAPRFSYRGFHVDVSRHFRSVDFLDEATPYQTQYEVIDRALFGPYVLPKDVFYFATFRTNENVWGTIGGHIFCYRN